MSWKISCAVCDMYKKNMSVGKMKKWKWSHSYGLLRTVGGNSNESDEECYMNTVLNKRIIINMRTSLIYMGLNNDNDINYKNKI